MLYKLDKNGFVINNASVKKIQPYYRNILKKINKIYKNRLGDNLLSVYIRGSVSVGRATSYISDLDSVAIIKNNLDRDHLLWVIEETKKLEKKYPKAGLVELTVVPLEELLQSKKYKNLRVYLKTQSVCLLGKDILPKLPKIKPGKKLALILYGNISEEIQNLKDIFSRKIVDCEYLFQKRSIKFWCDGMTRLLLRGGLGLVMFKKPVYSQDLKTCFNVFVDEYPEYNKEAEQLLKWVVNPIDDEEKLLKFLNNFSPKFLKLWENVNK